MVPRQTKTESQAKHKPRQQSLVMKSNKQRTMKQMMRGISGSNRQVQRNKHSQDLMGIQQQMAMADGKYQPYTVGGERFMLTLKPPKHGAMVSYGGFPP